MNERRIAKAFDNGPIRWPVRPALSSDELTLTELTFVRAIARGESVRATARRIGMAAGAASTAMLRLRQRLGVNSTVELMAHPLVVRALEEP